jgi:endo-1,4-beta-xylanase
MKNRQSRIISVLIVAIAGWGIVASLVTIFTTNIEQQLATVYDSRNDALVPQQQPLDLVKNFAAQHGVLFGTSYNIPDGRIPPSSPRPADFISRLAPYFNFYQVSYSFQTTEPQQGVFKLSDTDNLLAFAKSQNAPVKVHTLLYPGTTPAWISPDHIEVAKNSDGSDKFTPDELKEIEKNHIFGLINHFTSAFPGVITQYQVTNEVTCRSSMVGKGLCVGDDTLRKFVWNEVHKENSTDPSDYIQLAFQWAKEADPNGKLYFTESLSSPGSDADRIYELVKSLQGKGVPIDGFGMQGHVSLNWPYSSNGLVSLMNKFSDLGLDVQVTEFDVTFSDKAGSGNNPQPFPETAENLNQQGRLYRLWLDACLHAKRCIAFTAFTPWDPTSFYFVHPEVTNPAGLIPGLLDDNFQQKPAYTYLIQEAKEFGNDTVPLTYPAYLYLDSISPSTKFTMDGGMSIINGGLQKKMQFPKTATYTLSFNARGVAESDTYPDMNITIDGQTVKTVTVTSSSFTDYSTDVSINAGSHLIGVSLANPAKTRSLVVASLGAGAPHPTNEETTPPPVEEPENSNTDVTTPSSSNNEGSHIIGTIGSAAITFPVDTPVGDTAISSDQSLDIPISKVIHITTQKNTLQQTPSQPITSKSAVSSTPAPATITSIEYILDDVVAHTATTFPDTWSLDTTTLSNDWHTLSTVYHHADNSSTRSIRLFKVENKYNILEKLKDGTIRIFTSIQLFLKGLF